MHTFNGILVSHKRERNLAIFDNMGSIMLNEISQRKRNVTWFRLCVKYKNKMNEQTETTHRHRDQVNDWQM